MPLRIRWAIIMGAIVGLVMTASIVTVVSIQSRVIRAQVLDSGTSLATFIASEAATPMLGEDWIRLDAFVTEASKRETLEYLTITDHQETVRAATQADLQFEGAPKTIRESEATLITERTLPNGTDVFDFETTILFQNTRVGKINLGLSRAGLQELMDVTRLLMAILGIVTLTAVVGMLYVFGSLLTRPLRLLARSMGVFGGGDWDHRTSSARNDEIGDLFGAFNKMADGIQQRLEHPDEAPPSEDDAFKELEQQVADLSPDATIVVGPPRDAR